MKQSIIDYNTTLQSTIAEQEPKFTTSMQGSVNDYISNVNNNVLNSFVTDYSDYWS